MLLALVLCGGESRRMGHDKGLLLKEGIPWALHIGNLAGAMKIPVIYSINKTQEAAYREILPANQLMIDELDLPGPLNGLFSYHRRWDNTDILLLACDMLDLDTGTIQQLLAVYPTIDADYIAYGDEQFYQPFCCIYKARGLQKIAQPPPSLQALLKAGETHRLAIPNSSAFNNYNTP